MSRPEPCQGAAIHGADIHIAGLTHVFDTPAGPIHALTDISLDVSPGAALAVMGPSGSGKSTLLHLLGAMLPARHGEVSVDGEDLARLSGRRLVSYRRTVGFVFQRFHLLPVLTAVDNVAAPVLPYRTPYDKRGRARDLLTEMGLGHRLDTVPARLSGGEQQRVAIARALINSPRLLLADEPTGNLDADTGAQIIDLLLHARAQHGTTLLLATHDPAVAERCDRIIRLADGRLEPAAV